jgi:hypothetical protein
MRTCLLLLAFVWSAITTAGHSQFSVAASADLPAFFYPGDQPKLQFLLANNSGSEQTGNLQLELFDAVKKQPVDGWFYNQLANQYFTLAAGERNAVRFPITIPNLFTGKVFWQLTVRIDTTHQLVRGYFDVRDADHQTEAAQQEYQRTMKGGIGLIAVNKQSARSVVEQAITAFSTQPVGQPVVLRMATYINQKMDSCLVLLPLSAGLQSTGNNVQFKKGKPTSIVQKSKSDTAISMMLYGLAPGLYQWDYPFTARYPGEFLVPSCRLLLFNAIRREYRTATSSILID